jgi:hypothetical protein
VQTLRTCLWSLEFQALIQKPKQKTPSGTVFFRFTRDASETVFFVHSLLVLGVNLRLPALHL